MIEKIKKLYLFEWIDDDFLETLVNNSKIETYIDWEKIIIEWEKAEKAYIIIEWIVNVEKNNEFLNTIFQGDIFGEIGLVTNEKRTASIISETQVKLLVLDRENLVKLINKYPNGEFIKNTILNRIMMNKNS